MNQSNPYIGPRAFQMGERMYGRDQAASQLMNLIIAERIVLLHSPSGAGKTSLIQAALIPRLLKARFRVMPVVRVNLDSSAVRLGEPGINRYVYSAILSLEESLSFTQQVAPIDLAGLSLPDYLARRTRSDGELDIQVFIFDQFEEILTLDPTDLAAKREFFKQLGDALEAPNRWALFSMREDHVAALDPYKLHVPSRLANTFRLDLLGQEAARQAIQEPARQAGVEFEDEAAERLVDDLRRVRVQQLDGSMEPQLGPYVEPVQLQVVCHRLWEAARATAARITPHDLDAFGQVDRSLVDQSLAQYYAERVADAAAETGISERSIREWCSRQLITEQGVRGTVLMGKERSGSLDNRAIQSLVNAYLVRGEQRGGATWFELSHDRLIGPVRADNTAWFKANLSLVQQRADVWDQQDRPESLLLGGSELAEARLWATDHRAELLPVEVDYLDASHKQASRALRLRRRNQIISMLGVASMVLAILTLLAFRTAAGERDRALRQERLARSGQLAAQSQAVLQGSPPRSMLLAVEALSVTLGAGEPRLVNAEIALRGVLSSPHGSPLPGHAGAITALAFSPECGSPSGASNEAGSGTAAAGLTAAEPCERWLVTGSEDNTARLWSVGTANPVANPLVLFGHEKRITAVAFSPEGRWVATGSADQTLRLWDLHAGDPSAPSLVLNSPGRDVYALAFSPECVGLPGPPGEAGAPTAARCGPWLAAGGLDGRVLLWDVDALVPGAVPVSLTGHQASVLSLAFSPDGRWLATGSADKTVRLWDMTADDVGASVRVLHGHEGVITSLAFSAAGRWLASGSRDKTARLWDLASTDPETQSRVLLGHNDWVNAVAFGPECDRPPEKTTEQCVQWLATGSGDATTRLWNLSAGKEMSAPRVLTGHEGSILTLAFSPDGRWVATGSVDRTVRVWDLSTTDPGLAAIVLRGHEDWVNALAFSPWCYGQPGESSGLAQGAPEQCIHLLATASKDGTARLWVVGAVDPATDPVVLSRHEDQVNALALSADGRWLATGGGDPAGDNTDNTVRLWDFSEGPVGEPILLRGHEKWISTLAFGPECDAPSGSSGETDLAPREPCVRWLATGSGDDTVRLWNLNAGDVVTSSRVLRGHERPITALGFGTRCDRPPGASNAAVPGTDKATLEPAVRCTHWLATGSQDKTARLWNLSAEDAVGSVAVLGGHESAVRALAISPDGRWLATNSDYTTFLWDLSAMGADPVAPAYTLHQHSDFVTSLAFSPDSHWLATGGGSNDKTIRVWDLHASDPTANPLILTGPQSEVTVLAFSPGCGAAHEAPAAGCDRWLAAAGKDKTTRLWRMDPDGPGGSPLILAGHLQPITALAFSADGNSLATGSDDKTARLWDLRVPNLTAQPVVLQGHTAGITTLAFDPEGRWLATGSTDHSVRVWSLFLDHLVSLACAGAGRNLTQDEWSEFFPGELYRKTCLQWP